LYPSCSGLLDVTTNTNGKPVLKLDRLIPKNKGAVQAQQALAYSLEDDIDDDDEDQAVAQLGHIEAETRNVFGGMARAYENEHVKCNFDYLDRIAQLSNSRASAYATADSGADTNVLGQEWLIIAMDPVRKINLVGFDAAHARKKRTVHCYCRYYRNERRWARNYPTCASVCFEQIDFNNVIVRNPNATCGTCSRFRP
jgi:hypothetical protein